MDFTWVLGCINTKWALHGLGLHCGNCDLCHFLQHIQIFPVNFNYSARTALYGYIIKEKTNTNNIVIVKETNSQHLLPCKIILGTCLVSKQYQELIKTNHFSSKATHSCPNTTIFGACNCQILSSHDLQMCFWQRPATLSTLPQELAWQKWPTHTTDASEKAPCILTWKQIPNYCSFIGLQALRRKASVCACVCVHLQVYLHF